MKGLVLGAAALALGVAGWCALAQQEAPGAGKADAGGRTFVVPTHPRMTFRKDDLAALRRKCLTTHAREYARLKASADAAAFLETAPVAPGLVYQLAGESRFLRYAGGDYDAFFEALAPEQARALADKILYRHRREMSLEGKVALSENLTHYLPLYDNRMGIVQVFGDDTSLALSGEMEQRLAAMVAVFRETREIYNAVAYRRGAMATTFHCVCFIDDGPRFYDTWRVATGENYFGDPMWTGYILEPMHNTLPFENYCATMTTAYGFDHMARYSKYLVATRVRDGLCQWIMNHPAWVSARDVGNPAPDDFEALGRTWENAIKDLGGYREGSWSGPVAWWPGHMPDRILYHDPTVAEIAPETLPTSALFEGVGLAVMRSAWTDDAVFARLHSGPNFRAEPPHLNDGTFVLYHKGWLVRTERGGLTSDANSILVKDPGETILEAGEGVWPDPLWNGKIAKTKAAKTNDGGQSWWTEDIGRMNLKCRGRISAYEASDLYTYSVADSTRSYNPAKLEQFTRQFLYIKPGLVVMFDRVKSTKPEFEKRWVVHTRSKPEPTKDPDVFMADAVSTAAWSVKGWDRTVGFEVPVYEKGPPGTVTQKFETLWDGVDVGVVFKTGPTFGKATWSLDGGAQKGEIDQNSAEEKERCEAMLARNIPKGSHTLVLERADGRVAFSSFYVLLGGRLFVTTLLPEKREREVTANETAQKDPYHYRSDWRVDVVAKEPRTDDVFLNVLEATDRSHANPVPVTRFKDGARQGLRFDYDGRSYEVLFNETGNVGGHIRIRAAAQVLADKDLPAGIVDADDPYVANCLALQKKDPIYGYDVGEIAHLTPKADRAELLKALADPRWHVRFYALRALGMKREAGVWKEVARLLGDGEPRVASAAAEALGRLGAKDAGDDLIRVLGTGQDEAKFYAAWALGELKAARAVDALVKALSEANDFVSVSAAEALGKIADPRAAEALSAAMDRRDAVHMKAAYLWALASVGTDAAARRLEEFQDSQDMTLRACAIAGLVKRPGKEAAAAVLRKALADPEKSIASFARRKLVALEDEGALKDALATAQDKEASFAARAACLKSLGEAGWKPAAEDLARLLEDQQAYPSQRRDSISAHAALVLCRLGDGRGVKFLEGALAKGAEPSTLHVARGAAEALASVEKGAAVPILIAGLSVPRTQIADDIATSLFVLTGEDPGADIAVLGWRRPALEAARWKDWWEKNKGRYGPPGP